MKVAVDYDACAANAVCAGLVPEVFEVDDDDNLKILMDEIPANLVDAQGTRARSCPNVALRLSEQPPQYSGSEDRASR